MAEREGFEPSEQVSLLAPLARACFQPLSHLSGPELAPRPSRALTRHIVIILRASSDKIGDKKNPEAQFGLPGTVIRRKLTLSLPPEYCDIDLNCSQHHLLSDPSRCPRHGKRSASPYSVDNSHFSKVSSNDSVPFEEFSIKV